MVTPISKGRDVLISKADLEAAADPVLWVEWADALYRAATFHHAIGDAAFHAIYRKSGEKSFESVSGRYSRSQGPVYIMAGLALETVAKALVLSCKPDIASGIQSLPFNTVTLMQKVDFLLSDEECELCEFLGDVVRDATRFPIGIHVRDQDDCVNMTDYAWPLFVEVYERMCRAAQRTCTPRES